MQKLHILISNLKQQSVLSIALTAIVSNAIYSIWFQIPFVANTLFGPMPPDALNQTAYFGMTLFGILNMLVATLGLAMLIPKKGVLTGFLIGTVVAVFFAMNAYLSSYIGAPLGVFPPTEVLVVTLVGLMVFYAIPGTLLGYLRKE